MRRLVPAALVAALLAAPVMAHHDGEIVTAGALRLSHAWTEETGATAHAIEVYLTIENTGAEPDRLVAARTDFTRPAMFQAPVLQADGTLAVQEVAALEIAPGQSLTLQPGSIHLVLNDVKRRLEGGEHFDLVLEFARAGAVEIEVEIEHADEEGEHDHEERPAS